MVQRPADIRTAEGHDVPGIERVARASWATTYAGIIPEEIQCRLLDTWYSAAALARALSTRGSTFLVAASAGTIVGFAQYVRRSGATAELTRLYVLPEHQRGGIGTQLLEAGVAACRQQGARHLTVSVERDNAVGRAFYRKRGFAEIGEHTQDVQGYSLCLVTYRRPL